MQIIIEHTKDISSYLRQRAIRIESLGRNYKLIEIKERYLSFLDELAYTIEPNFKIELLNNEYVDVNNTIDCADMILAIIGINQQFHDTDCFYNMTNHTYKTVSPNRAHHKCLQINCYSKNHQTTAADFIKCTAYLKKLAQKLHKPILIYANIFIPDEKLRYRSLAFKIINGYLENINGGMIIKCPKEDIYKYGLLAQRSYEPYMDKVIYENEDLKNMLPKVLPFFRGALKDNTSFKNIHSSYRQITPLFQNNFFYNAISPDEEIYVFLDAGNSREPEYYESLGLKHVPLIGDYGMLYARKSQFDALSNVLRPQVTVNLRMHIFSHVACERNQSNQPISYSLTAENLKYKGKGVYIGLITTDDVDYTNEVLRYQNGTTRIAYIWQQIRANDGVRYFKDQIDSALNNPDPGSVISLPEGDSMSTMMLGIAGGESARNGYRGIATESEFIIAKIKPASEALQRIYGGMPSQYGVLLQNVMVAVVELANFAREREMPLVLCVPFNTNIDPHDGSLILYDILQLIARRAGVSIIVPVGEEANKQHHYSVGAAEQSLSTVAIRVGMPNQNVVGVMYQRVGPFLSALLSPPRNISSTQIDLKNSGITQTLSGTVYSNGEVSDFLNGQRRILFRLENPEVGEWVLENTFQTNQSIDYSLWISQQELNPYITLSPSDAFTTLGSSACLNNVMGVGAFAEEQRVVLASSGRGYTRDQKIQPLLVTNGSQIIAPCRRGEWVSISGTLPAASIMAGVAATVYSKLIDEGRFPLPNTLGITNIILSVIQQFEGISYPNPSMGYGFFNLNQLNTLLNIQT